jgi:hypothetical protein
MSRPGLSQEEMTQIEGNETMTVERYLRGIAGFFILLSVALAYFHSRYWLLFTAFVGLNLFQSAFTNWCLMMAILRWAGIGGGKTLCCAVKPSVTGAEKPK